MYQPTDRKIFSPVGMKIKGLSFNETRRYIARPGIGCRGHMVSRDGEADGKGKRKKNCTKRGQKLGVSAGDISRLKLVSPMAGLFIPAGRTATAG